MPLYHSSASCLGVCGALFSGATVSIGRRFSTKTFWKEVRETGATIIQYVGETCRYLTVAPPEKDPVTGESLDRKHRVRVAMGNGLRPDVWDRFKDRFGIDVSCPCSCDVRVEGGGHSLTTKRTNTCCRPSSNSTLPPRDPWGCGTGLETRLELVPLADTGSSPAPSWGCGRPLSGSTTRWSFRGVTRPRASASE